MDDVVVGLALGGLWVVFIWAWVWWSTLDEDVNPDCMTDGDWIERDKAGRES